MEDEFWINQDIKSKPSFLKKLKSSRSGSKEKLDKKSPLASSKFANNFEIEISMIEGVYSPKIDYLFQDFDEGSIEELSESVHINGTVIFLPHGMDLKKL